VQVRFLSMLHSETVYPSSFYECTRGMSLTSNRFINLPPMYLHSVSSLRLATCRTSARCTSAATTVCRST
jgi:hypothetical protein